MRKIHNKLTSKEFVQCLMLIVERIFSLNLAAEV